MFYVFLFLFLLPLLVPSGHLFPIFIEVYLFYFAVYYRYEETLRTLPGLQPQLQPSAEASTTWSFFLFFLFPTLGKEEDIRRISFDVFFFVLCRFLIRMMKMCVLYFALIWVVWKKCLVCVRLLLSEVFKNAPRPRLLVTCLFCTLLDLVLVLLNGLDRLLLLLFS